MLQLSNAVKIFPKYFSETMGNGVKIDQNRIAIRKDYDVALTSSCVVFSGELGALVVLSRISPEISSRVDPAVATAASKINVITFHFINPVISVTRIENLSHMLHSTRFL